MRDLEWGATAVADLMAIVDYISDDNPDARTTLDCIGEEHARETAPARRRIGKGGHP